eukprot:scaffold14224_cov106-Skeletonema_dohrnii-CCMP3373.AAC.4
MSLSLRLSKSAAAAERSLLTNQSMYPGLNEAMLGVGETTLSRGSDCIAVWFCPRRMKTPIVG